MWFFGGSCSDVGGQSAKNDCVKKIVDSGEIGPRDKGAPDPPHLAGTELEIIKFLKQDSPSKPLSKIYDLLLKIFIVRFPVELQRLQ